MKLLLNYWRKATLLSIIFLSVIACARNPANQLAKELYPKFQHLSAPEHSFEQLWHLFDQNYAFFELKGVNWDSTYLQYRPLVDSNTNEDSLLYYFAAMLNPLRDGHIRLTRADTNLIQLDRRPCQFAKTFRGRLRDFQENTFTVLSQNGFAEIQHQIPIPEYQSIGYDYLYSYTQSPTIGYLRVVDCRDELAVFDQVLSELANTEGLILDLRYNLGGEVGKEMAARFLAKDKEYAYKKVRQKNGFSSAIPLKVKAVKKPYRRPVILLINDATFSAAEELSLVLSTEQQVKLIGESTGGYLSDAFTYRLPNGMISSLSHEQYFDLDHHLLEEAGIQPDVFLQNTLADLSKGKDPLIQKAILLLKSAQKHD